jgi:hypothetical protein
VWLCAANAPPPSSPRCPYRSRPYIRIASGANTAAMAADAANTQSTSDTDTSTPPWISPRDEERNSRSKGPLKGGGKVGCGLWPGTQPERG